jgi:peptidoglycan/xylan/chitin deacetylase (PgdA/CDA1 family)
MIFVYHDINIISKNENTVSIIVFVFQMLLILITNKKVVSLQEFFLKQDKDNVVICFDDGYKHVKKYALFILKIFRFPFEIFVCSDFVKKGDYGNKKYLSLKDLKSIVTNKIRIQYHTKSHKRLTEINNQDELKTEIVCPDFLKNVDEKGFDYIAYPYWVWNKNVIDIVKENYRGARSGNGYANNTMYAFDSVKVKNSIIDMWKFLTADKRPETLAGAEERKEV